LPPAPKPANESERLDSLWAHEILDTPPEPDFDALTELAAAICAAPLAIVSLVDADRQWFKSQCGRSAPESTGRDEAFCAYTILQRDLLEISDTRLDPRVADAPSVCGAPYFRFYAGMPLIAPDGMALGSLCVIDYEPRTLTGWQRQQLERLARATVGLITARVRRSAIDGRRLALLDCALDAAVERADQLRVLSRLAAALEGAADAGEIERLALEAALGLCRDSRGSIVTGTFAEPLPAEADGVAVGCIGPATGPALVLTRDGDAAFTRSDRALLEIVAGMARLACRNAAEALA
jgi:GAF domain-containing protein